MAAAHRVWAAAGWLRQGLLAPWFCKCRTRLPNELPRSFMLLSPKPFASYSRQYRGTIEELDDFCRKGDLSNCLQVLNLLDRKEIKLHAVTYSSLMKLCVDCGSIMDARYLHEHSFRTLGNANLLINNQILDMYAKHKSMEDAKKLFNAMPYRDTTSWMNLVIGCASNGLGREAVDNFIQFSDAGVEPAIGEFVELAVQILKLLESKRVVLDVLRYVQLIEVCKDAATATQATSVHEHIKRAVGCDNIRVNNKILQMYAKCNSAKSAKELFDSMPIRNLTSWESIIMACTNAGLGEEALDYFNQFLYRGIQPDSGMFAIAFLACGGVGAVDEGMLLLESMEKEYGIVPSMEHYVSIVKMLGYSGYVEEAMEFVEQMPLEPSVDVWIAMMDMSLSYGHLELGNRCAEVIQCLNPSRLKDQTKSALLSVNAWEIERGKEIKKNEPSTIEKKSADFRAGDQTHPNHPKLYQHLRFLLAQMKDEGYVADMRSCLHDVDPEVKERSLHAHSERLAIAQAFLTSNARSPIKITKNLRSCIDCHQALKLMSKLSGRSLVVRDTKRWHYFNDGKCNCDDYW